MNAREVSYEEITAEFPDMEFDIKGGVYFPEDAHVHPGELLKTLFSHLKKQGVEFVENCEITNLTTNENRVVKMTGNGDVFEVEELLIASGSWSPDIAEQLDFSIPIQAGKGYSVTIDKPWQIDTPIILSDSAVAITPFEEQIRFGATMEIAGIDLSINPRRIDGIINSVKQFIPNFEIHSVNKQQAWAGLRPCSPDGLPLVGRVAKYDNLILATGHAMLGLTLAPVTGKIVSDLVSRRVQDTGRFLDAGRFG